MIAILNKFRIAFCSIRIFLAVLSTLAALASCSENDALEIQNDFPFDVKVMPVPKEVANRQTVEIRLTIQRTGNYSNTQFFLRYFQFDGQGSLQYYDELPYLPNDLYPLPAEQFRLYYTSASTVSQSFYVWISDSFGNEKQIRFQFSNID